MQRKFFIIGSSFLKEVLLLSFNNQSHRTLIGLQYSQYNPSFNGACIGTSFKYHKFSHINLSKGKLLLLAHRS